MFGKYCNRRGTYEIILLLLFAFLVSVLFHKNDMTVNENLYNLIDIKKNNIDFFYNNTLFPTIVMRKGIFTNFECWVHLDLKGAPPKLSYYKELFPWLHANSASGILLEYEDMFPYKGELEVLKTKHAYTEHEVKDILSLATENHLSVIPLVQTFGHFEFVLKHDKFKHMKEHPGSLKNLNPAKPESLSLVKLMIDQIMAVHSKVSYIHLGCDEVYFLGVSNETKAKIAQGWTKQSLYLDHLKSVASYVKSNFPKVTPLIWDDMLRGMQETLIKKSQIGSLVEPVLWCYETKPQRNLPPQLWAKYSKIFKRVWVASAFKGATGPAQDITPIQYHLSNHHEWLKILQQPKMGGTVHVGGITITGWQRYEHHRPLCELLPEGLPSLAYCMEAILYGSQGASLQTLVSNKLNCDAIIPLTIDGASSQVNCTFPGVEVYRAIHGIHHIVYQLGKGIHCKKNRRMFQISKKTLHNAMASIFFEDSVSNWFKDHIDTKRISNILNKCLP